MGTYYIRTELGDHQKDLYVDEYEIDYNDFNIVVSSVDKFTSMVKEKFPVTTTALEAASEWSPYALLGIYILALVIVIVVIWLIYKLLTGWN